MSRKWRNVTASFQANVALAAAGRDQSTARLASKFAVQSSQITARKKQLVKGVTDLFVNGGLTVV